MASSQLETYSFPSKNHLCWQSVVSPLQASVCWTWRSSSPSQRPVRPCWRDCWKLSRGKVSLTDENLDVEPHLSFSFACKHELSTCDFLHRMVLVNLCFPDDLQVWITRRCTEHSLLEVDLKSDSILNVVSSFFFLISRYICNSWARQTDTTERKHQQRPKENWLTKVVMKSTDIHVWDDRKRFVCLRVQFDKKNNKSCGFWRPNFADCTCSQSERCAQDFKYYNMFFCTSDPPSPELDQVELPILCDGLRRYLQDLPQPVIPTAIYTQMVHTAKGESSNDHTCTVGVHFYCQVGFHIQGLFSGANLV